MNRLTVVLLILGVGLALLIFNHDSGSTLGIDNDRFGSLVALGAIAAMFAAGILQSRRHLGESARQIAIWFLVTLVLVTGYVYRYDLEAIASRVTAGLIPGRATVFTDNEGMQEVVLHKSIGGHFGATVSVNGQSVGMLVDTGASRVVLSYEDAERLGLDPANLAFTQTVLTANGQARAAPISLEQVAVGPIVRSDVRASVAEEGRLDQSLLGMSFLSTLDFLQMRTDELRLRD